MNAHLPLDDEPREEVYDDCPVCGTANRYENSSCYECGEPL